MREFKLRQQWAKANIDKCLISIEKYNQKMIYYNALIEMTKEELNMYQEILGKTYLEVRESSEDKQKRLNCNGSYGVDNWNCYKDCAFWNGHKCTNHEKKLRKY